SNEGAYVEEHQTGINILNKVSPHWNNELD
ncbi:DUF3267 domain-containing protein, partial [Staphylococcus cohnii]